MATICCSQHRFENVEAILFDKDGTLANVESYLRALGEARAHHINAQVPGVKASLMTVFGIEERGINSAGLMAVGSRHENEIAAAACIAATGLGWIDSLNLASIAFQQAKGSLPKKVEETPLLEGAKPLLRRIHSAGIKSGIVSADTHLEVATFIDRHQLSEISWYCGASAVAPAKTHPDFLEFACDAMSIDSTATLVIGDSASDLQLALQGAAGFIGMTGGWRTSPTISLGCKSTDNIPVATINRLNQVESFD